MGTLLWVTLTHPEAAYYVSYLCQFMHDPSLAAYDAGLNILAYLLSAKDLGLTFTRLEPEIVAYSDASWNQVPIPFGGHLVIYGKRLCPTRLARSRSCPSRPPRPIPPPTPRQPRMSAT